MSFFLLGGRLGYFSLFGARKKEEACKASTGERFIENPKDLAMLKLYDGHSKSLLW